MLITRGHKGCNLPHPLRLAQTDDELSRICNFRKQRYEVLYPEIGVFLDDPFDDHSYVIYSESADGQIASTARLVLDSNIGLPEDDVFATSAQTYRNNGQALMELGRFVIKNTSTELLKRYYRAFHYIATEDNVHTILMVMREKDVAFHKNLIGAHILPCHVENGFGSHHTFVGVAWELARTKSRFLRWIAESPRDTKVSPASYQQAGEQI